MIETSLVHRLSVLAAALDGEVALCLTGRTSHDTAFVREFYMPEIVASGPDSVVPESCGSGTLAVWHNHPWTGPDSSFGVRAPEDLCSLSEPDIRTVVSDSVPFAVVSVGRAPQPVICWWRRVQVVDNRRVRYLPRFPTQWATLPGVYAPGAETMPKGQFGRDSSHP
ncbi:MAG TPA: hypothetical protein VLT79_11250 [Gemmatimonadales bacterium]|nr:hypothetical protein [Gemmatimonadales bacterium]